MSRRPSSTFTEMTTTTRMSQWQKKKVTTHIVSAKSKLVQQRSIMGAIAQAAPYDRIEIEGGEYHELISLTFPLEIVGVIGEHPTIVSRGTGFQLSSECDCYIEGVVFENRSKDVDDFAVVLAAGSPIFVNTKLSNVSVVGSSSPTFSNCEISESVSGIGVKVSYGSMHISSSSSASAVSPTFDNCKIQYHNKCAIVVEGVGTQLAAMFRQCRINQNVGATAIACIEGVQSTSVSARNVTFTENQISYRKAHVNEASGEVELLQGGAVETDYRYSAPSGTAGSGGRDPCCAYILGCGQNLRFHENDFSDGVVGIYLERGASPVLDSNKVRRMSCCGMRVAVGTRSANEKVQSSTLKCGCTFDRCMTGIEVVISPDLMHAAAHSPVAAALEELQAPLFEEIDKVYLSKTSSSSSSSGGSGGVVNSRKWHEKLSNLIIELTAKCNIPSNARGYKEMMLTPGNMPNWDVVSALAKMHHSDLSVLSTETEHSLRDAVNGFLEAVHVTLRKVAPSAITITQAKFTDCQNHAVRYAAGSYGVLNHCSFDGVVSGAAILVEHDAFPVVVNCRFNACARSAVECHRSSQAFFVHNTIAHGVPSGSSSVLPSRSSSSSTQAETGAVVTRNGACGTFVANRIEYNSGFGVVVEGASSPVFFRNSIQSNALGGALIRDHARPLFDRNCFKANKKQIVITNYSNPRIFFNDIFAGEVGVLFTRCAIGFISGNSIFDNTESGIRIETDADPRIEDNLIARQVGHGISVKENGMGTITSNLIAASSLYGVVVETGGDCTVRGNTIGLNSLGGVCVQTEGLGRFEKNDIFCSQIEGNVFISGKHSEPVFDKNRIWRSKAGGGVVCDDGAEGTVRRNTIVSNGGAGVCLFRRSRTFFEHNRIESQLIGVCASLAGGGKFRKNKICLNGRAGLYIDQFGAPDVKDNAIDQNYCGVELRSSPCGRVFENSLEGNVFGVISGESDAVPASSQELAKKMNLFEASQVKHYATSTSSAQRRKSSAAATGIPLHLLQNKQLGNNSGEHHEEEKINNNNRKSKSNNNKSKKDSATSSDDDDDEDAQEDPTLKTDYADNKLCVVRSNHVCFNGLAGIALVTHASGRFYKNNLVGNAFVGVFATTRRCFELHNLANEKFLKECGHGETISILSSHKEAPHFATSVPGSGLFGDAFLEQNSISLHTHAGILVDGFERDSEIKFVENEINKNTIGIRLADGSRNCNFLFDGNECSKNVVGLHSAGSGGTSATFSENNFDFNSFAGSIIAGDSTPKFLTGNKFSNSRYFGCWVMGSSAPIFEPGNLFNDNVVAGIAIQQGADTNARFNGAVIKRNDRFGVFVYAFEDHPKFNGKGEFEMKNKKAIGGGGGSSNTNSAKKQQIASSGDATHSISYFRNCVIRQNGLVGIYVGALSKDFSDDIRSRGSVHTSSLKLDSSSSSSSTSTQQKKPSFSAATTAASASATKGGEQEAIEKAFEGYTAFSSPGLSETVTSMNLIAGNLAASEMSSPQHREREKASDSVTHNAGPSVLPHEDPHHHGSRVQQNQQQHQHQKSSFAAGDRSTAGRPPFKGFVRGGSVLFYQCAIKGNRLGALVDRNADPVFSKTVLAQNLSAGIVLSPGSLSCLTENVIESNALCGIVACPQSRCTVIGCEVLENNKAELLEDTAAFDDKMKPIGGVAALISLDTVKFSESDINNHSPSRWNVKNSPQESALGVIAEAEVKKNVATFATVLIGSARSDARMAHRSAHHYSGASKFRLSPTPLFSATLLNQHLGIISSLNSPTSPAEGEGGVGFQRKNLHVVTVKGGQKEETPTSTPTTTTGGGAGRARSRSVVSLRPVGGGGNSNNSPSRLDIMMGTRSGSSSSSGSGGGGFDNNKPRDISWFDAAKLSAHRLNSLVHGVGIWIEEGSECEVTHNTVFGHVVAGFLVTTDGLTSDQRSAYESEMLAQTQATVAPGDRFSSALQEAMAFVSATQAGSQVVTSSIKMNLIHHNRGAGVRVIAASSDIVDGIVKQAKSGSKFEAASSSSSSSTSTSATAAASGGSGGKTATTTTAGGSGARGVKAAKFAHNDLLDVSDVADAPGCTSTTAHPLLRHVTETNASLTCPGLTDVSLPALDHILCSDSIIGGANDDRARGSLARFEENEIEFNAGGGVVAEFILCGKNYVRSSNNSNNLNSTQQMKRDTRLDDSRKLELVGSSLVPPTRVLRNTFRANGKFGSIMVRSAVHVDLLAKNIGGVASNNSNSNTASYSSSSSSSFGNYYPSSPAGGASRDLILLEAQEAVSSCLRASSLPGLAPVSDFYMPCVIENNVFVDPPEVSHSEHQSLIVRAPCVALIGHCASNIRFNEFSSVHSGSAVVVAREVSLLSSSTPAEFDNKNPRSDVLDPVHSSSGVVIGPGNTFESNNLDVTVSGAGLNDCAIVNNIFKQTKGVSVLVTGGARPVVVGNRFHGQTPVPIENDSSSNSASGEYYRKEQAGERRRSSVSAASASAATSAASSSSSSSKPSTVDHLGERMQLRKIIGRGWEKVVVPPKTHHQLSGGVFGAAITCATRNSSPWILANQFDANTCALRVTEDASCFASLNVFSGNKRCSVLVDDSEHGAPIFEKNLFCRSNSDAVIVDGRGTRCLIRRNVFRDILSLGSKSQPQQQHQAAPPSSSSSSSSSATSAAAGGGGENEKKESSSSSSSSGEGNSSSSAILASVCAIKVLGASSPWIDSNGFQDVAVGVLLQSAGTLCAVSRNAFFRCGTGTLIGQHAFAPHSSSTSSSSSENKNQEHHEGGESNNSSSPPPSSPLASASTSTVIVKAVVESKVACITHNVFECPLGIGVRVRSTQHGSDAAAISTNVFLATPVRIGEGGNSISCCRNVFIGENAMSNSNQETSMYSSLRLESGSRASFIENYILGSRVGVLCDKQSSGVIVNSTFYRCTSAVELSAGVQTSIEGCKLLACSSTAVKAASGKISNCKIYKTGGNFAVEFTAAHQKEYATISDSEICCSENDAVRFSGSGAVENSVVNICKNGMRFNAGLNCVCDIRSTYVMDCEKLGVIFSRQNNGALIDCDVFDCGIVAVVLEEGSAGEINGGRISSHLDHGAMDMETGTRVVRKSPVIRNQFSPSHKGKLTQVRQKETIEKVNAAIEDQVVEEERVMTNAKWGVELRVRLLGESEKSVKHAQAIMFENEKKYEQQRRAGQEAMVQQQRRNSQEKHRRDHLLSGKQQQEGEEEVGGMTGGFSSSSSSSTLPGIDTISPGRQRSDRGFELSNFIANKKNQKLQANNNTNNNNKQIGGADNNSTSNAAANSKPNSRRNSGDGGGISPTTTTTATSTSSTKRTTSTRTQHHPQQQQARASTTHENAPKVAEKSTFASRMKITEADSNVQPLHRKTIDVNYGSSASNILDSTSSGGGGGGGGLSSTARASSSSSRPHNNNHLSSPEHDQERPFSTPPLGSSPPHHHATTPTATKQTTTTKNTTKEPRKRRVHVLAPSEPVFSRVLLHSVGDAESSGYTKQVAQTLEESLGEGHCMIMKTSSSDPVEAMLGAATCSHVVVVYPQFPMRKRPTEAETKALFDIACYVEMSQQQQQTPPATPAEGESSQQEEFGNKPKIQFKGAWCVVQPSSFADFNPSSSSANPSPSSSPIELSSTSAAAGGGFSSLPPVKSASPSLLSPASTTSASGGVIIDKALKLPPSFTQVQGSNGLVSSLHRGGAGTRSRSSSLTATSTATPTLSPAIASSTGAFGAINNNNNSNETGGEKKKKKPARKRSNSTLY